VIRPEVDEPVVGAEVSLGCKLDTDQQAHFLLDGLHERRREFESVSALEPAVEVHERNPGALFRSPAGLDDILDGLLRDFRVTDVAPRRAEAAIEARVPELADRVDVDAEIRALQDADA
jgi:hypothetical protein